MKKALIAAALVATAFVVPAWAADSSQPVTPPQDFKARKAQIVKRMDERLADMQQERKCIQSAKSDDDLRACRDKQRSMMESRREQMRARRAAMMKNAATNSTGK